MEHLIKQLPAWWGCRMQGRKMLNMGAMGFGMWTVGFGMQNVGHGDTKARWGSGGMPMPVCGAGRGQRGRAAPWCRSAFPCRLPRGRRCLSCLFKNTAKLQCPKTAGGRSLA